MAFQQSRAQRTLAARPTLLTDSTGIFASGPGLNARQPSASTRKYSPTGTEEWILFSPEDAHSAHTSGHGIVRSFDGITEFLSDNSGPAGVGSFGPVVASIEHGSQKDFNNGNESDYDHSRSVLRAGTEHVAEGEFIPADKQAASPASDRDTEDLDSLDDGLGAFHDQAFQLLERKPPVYPVLPTSDGFGSFGLNPDEVKRQITRVNNSASHMHSHSPSTLTRTLQSLEQPDRLTAQEERNQRIEKWRLEQSKALLDEIERETRRMRKITQRSQSHSLITNSSSGLAHLNSTAGSLPTPHPNPSSTSQTSSHEIGQLDADGNDSLWRRFTRKVIRDLMGIDQTILSVIFGESLPEEILSSGTFPFVKDAPPDVSHSDVTWEERLLGRIARELGDLVNRLSSEHPGSEPFSSYPRSSQPEFLSSRENPPVFSPKRSQSTGIQNSVFRHKSAPSTPKQSSVSLGSGSFHHSVSSDMLFSPAFQSCQNNVSGVDTSIWGIEDKDPDHCIRPNRSPISPTHAPPSKEPRTAREDQDYWERELDIKMVINFIYKRFSSRPSSPSRENTTISNRPASCAVGSPVATSRQSTSAVTFQSPETCAANHRPVSASRGAVRYQPISAAARLSARRRAAAIRANHPLAPGAAFNPSRIQTPERRDLESGRNQRPLSLGSSAVSLSIPSSSFSPTCQQRPVTTTHTGSNPDADSNLNVNWPCATSPAANTTAHSMLPNTTFFFSSSKTYQPASSSCASESAIDGRGVSHLQLQAVLGSPDLSAHGAGPTEERRANISLSASISLESAGEPASPYWELGPGSDSGVIV